MKIDGPYGLARIRADEKYIRAAFTRLREELKSYLMYEAVQKEAEKLCRDALIKYLEASERRGENEI